MAAAFSGPNFDESFEALLLDMDVRRRMVVMPHAHDDAKEHGEDRHRVPIRGNPCCRSHGAWSVRRARHREWQGTGDPPRRA